MDVFTTPGKELHLAKKLNMASLLRAAGKPPACLTNEPHLPHILIVTISLPTYPVRPAAAATRGRVLVCP